MQSLFGTSFAVIALVVSFASVGWWDHLSTSDPVFFDLAVSVSLLITVASNLAANWITIAHIKDVGFQGELNPFARYLYRRFGLRSGYVQAVVALPLLYAVCLFFFIESRFVALSFFFALFPLLLFYDALQDYVVVTRKRRRHLAENSLMDSKRR